MSKVTILLVAVFLATVSCENNNNNNYLLVKLTNAAKETADAPNDSKKLKYRNLGQGKGDKKKNATEAKGEPVKPPFLPDGSRNDPKTKEQIEDILRADKMKKGFRHGGYYGGWCWNGAIYQYYQCARPTCYWDYTGCYRCY